MSSSSSEVTSLHDCPYDILVEIMLRSSTDDRVAFGNSCERFKSVVVDTPQLLRNLDFSKQDRRTRLKDIKQYFVKNRAKHIVKLSLRYIVCYPRGKLNISNAINLVDLDVRGTEFNSVKEVASFLEPLENLKRLSIDWPDVSRTNCDAMVTNCRNLLQKQLGRLEYLSVGMSPVSEAFVYTLSLCKELQELDVNTGPKTNYWREPNGSLLRDTTLQLNNLKILHICGGDSSAEDHAYFKPLVPEKRNWVEFRSKDSHGGSSFYLEKNVQVCDELCTIKSRHSDDFGWSLISEYLLKRVIEITYEDVPEEICCFESSDHYRCRVVLITIDQAKRLLLDPTYQISYLHFRHPIEFECDAHLVVSAFPNLTEIVLSDIVKKNKSVSGRRRNKNFARRLRRRGGVEPEENTGSSRRDSSFKMLVENTPLVTRLTIAGNMKYEDGLRKWDFNALYSIRFWKNLRFLRLKSVPITDGKFFIDIGKECANLEEIVLEDLGPNSSKCYMSGLCEMLRNCNNLREFIFHQYCINDMHELLNSLSNNSQLKSVRFLTEPYIETHDSVDVITSIEQLLSQCKQITTFVFITHHKVHHDVLRRIVDELKRPLLNYIGVGAQQKPPVATIVPSLLDSFKPH